MSLALREHARTCTHALYLHRQEEPCVISACVKVKVGRSERYGLRPQKVKEGTHAAHVCTQLLIEAPQMWSGPNA